MFLVTRYNRWLIFGLAARSFACLLGQFYGLWSMRAFAGWVLLPVTVLLAGIAAAARDRKSGPAFWVIEGSLGGLVAALAYDLFRLPFVLRGYPLFDVFPRFGQMLLGASRSDFSLPVQLTGWAHHFSNGAALGIMLLAIVAPALRTHAVPRGFTLFRAASRCSARLVMERRVLRGGRRNHPAVESVLLVLQAQTGSRHVFGPHPERP